MPCIYKLFDAASQTQPHARKEYRWRHLLPLPIASCIIPVRLSLLEMGRGWYPDCRRQGVS